MAKFSKPLSRDDSKKLVLALRNHVTVIETHRECCLCFRVTFNPISIAGKSAHDEEKHVTLIMNACQRALNEVFLVPFEFEHQLCEDQVCLPLDIKWNSMIDTGKHTQRLQLS